MKNKTSCIKKRIINSDVEKAEVEEEVEREREEVKESEVEESEVEESEIEESEIEESEIEDSDVDQDNELKDEVINIPIKQKNYNDRMVLNTLINSCDISDADLYNVVFIYIKNNNLFHEILIKKIPNTKIIDKICSIIDHRLKCVFMIILDSMMNKYYVSGLSNYMVKKKLVILLKQSKLDNIILHIYVHVTMKKMHTFDKNILKCFADSFLEQQIEPSFKIIDEIVQEMFVVKLRKNIIKNRLKTFCDAFHK